MSSWVIIVITTQFVHKLCCYLNMTTSGERVAVRLYGTVGPTHPYQCVGNDTRSIGGIVVVLQGTTKTTQESWRCQLCRHWWHRNMRCHQWRQCWDQYGSRFSWNLRSSLGPWNRLGRSATGRKPSRNQSDPLPGDLPTSGWSDFQTDRHDSSAAEWCAIIFIICVIISRPNFKGALVNNIKVRAWMSNYNQQKTVECGLLIHTLISAKPWQWNDPRWFQCQWRVCYITPI